MLSLSQAPGLILMLLRLGWDFLGTFWSLKVMLWMLRAVFTLRRYKAATFHTLLKLFCFKTVNPIAIRQIFRYKQGNRKN